MRILERWLKQYCDFSLPPDTLADRLTMLGLEFESVERLDERYRGFVVGKVVSRSKHPNADKLSVCVVDTGKEKLQIVCGAANVAAGQKVAVGLIGATVPKDQHDPSGAPFVLSRVTIRGVESFGMICSEHELDLGKDADGIMVLDPGARMGQSLASYFGMDDVAYNIEITPNRPDWLSHIGVAREVGVLTRRKVRLPRVRVKEGSTPIGRRLAVEVKDTVNCPRFAARMITGVTIAPSPRWLQNLLRNAGFRPRNNVVDITNFVMLECGHPMHAFDYATLRGGRIVVRHPHPGLRFVTLDGKEHTLPEETMMVCDGEREISIAGVMGGANSEISDTTADVVIESAYWDPSSIRRTSKRLGISTDASQRFERGADPNAVRFALDRAAQLMCDHAGGTLLKGVIDVYPSKIKERRVSVRPSRVNALLGTSLKPRDVERALLLVGVSIVGRSKDLLRCRVPTFRVDIDREVDLIEEAARVYGYDNIEEKTSAAIDIAHPFPTASTAGELRTTLIGAGFQEAITNSMQEEKKSAFPGATPVRILNPQNQEMATLRTSLVPGLLEVVARNINVGKPNLRLFELGHVFRVSGEPQQIENFLEEERICMLATGLGSLRHWSSTPRAADIFDLKGGVEDLLAKIHLDKCRFISYSTSNGLTDNTLAIEINGSYAGYLGSIQSDVLKAFAVDQDVFVAELQLAALRGEERRSFERLPRYPKVRRDVAFIVDEATTAEAVAEIIGSGGGELLQSVDVFDVYRGDPMPAGKKSLAFSLELMSREKTLTDAEIDAAVAAIVVRVERTLGATLRALS
jgi:phenylalanyl-tRNA synthetase beta chain